VAQENGLSANEPAKLPEGTVTSDALTPLVVQSRRLAFSFDGLVPPPDLVSGGENLIVAENEQVTDPFAVLFTLCADAGEALSARSDTPTPRATNTR